MIDAGFNCGEGKRGGEREIRAFDDWLCLYYLLLYPGFNRPFTMSPFIRDLLKEHLRSY